MPENFVRNPTYTPLKQIDVEKSYPTTEHLAFIRTSLVSWSIVGPIIYRLATTGEALSNAIRMQSSKGLRWMVGAHNLANRIAGSCKRLVCFTKPHGLARNTSV